MGTIITIQGGRFELRECITCGVAHAMPAVLLEEDRKHGGYRTCPNGHSQGWSKADSEEDKTRRERDRLKQQLAERDDEIAAERRRTEEARQESVRAQKETKRLKKRENQASGIRCDRSDERRADESEEMKLAIAYSTKDQVELTKQTLPQLFGTGAYIYWCDGSSTPKGVEYFERHMGIIKQKTRVTGGADAAIAFKLSQLLSHSEYTHIGLLENDVLLDPDWLEPTMALFEKGKSDGLEPGAVSPRSYVDRVLIQRDGYAVMHNIGAAAIIFTREAAEIVLRSFRTGFWRDNVRLFAQLSGIDLRTYACFRGQEDNPITSDWSWEAQLARHGLASLALTPARCQMVGQVPPLQEQGLELTTDDFVDRGPQHTVANAFETYQANLAFIRQGKLKLDEPGIIHRSEGGMLFFPHQLGYLAGAQPWQGTTELKNSQGFGPFAYRAGRNPDGVAGASLSVRVSSSCSFLVTGGSAGSKVDIRDTRSGFKFAPDLPPEGDNPISINVPGGPVPRQVTMDMSEGAVFYGLQTAEPQMLDSTFRFDWSQLPKAV